MMGVQSKMVLKERVGQQKSEVYTMVDSVTHLQHKLMFRCTSKYETYKVIRMEAIFEEASRTTTTCAQ